MLYKNPRGIGCNKCHGTNGNRQILATYKHKKKKKNIVVPQINNIEYEKFLNIFKKRRRGIMPKYFLTQEEIASIYFYITYKKSKHKKQ